MVETNSYIILTNRVPQHPYELRDGYILAPVQPLQEMFAEFSFGIPHHYKAVVALKWQGDKHPESYNIYRNLAVFHSFVSDDPETFQYTTERAIKEVLPGSELNAPDGSFEALDYDRFNMPIPILSNEDMMDSEEDIEPPFENGSREICYRDAFEFFSGLENSEDKKRVQLHNMIFSYVFIRGIWDIGNIALLYRNEDLSVLIYMAILENIVIKSGKNWKEQLVRKLNEWEYGWGDKYTCSIATLRPNRNRFAHGASYRDISQEMWKIYDKQHYSGQEFEEADLSKEAESSALKDNIEILERTVRKGLVELFVSEYEAWHQRQ